jgi:hypothetical protein
MNGAFGLFARSHERLLRITQRNGICRDDDDEFRDFAEDLFGEALYDYRRYDSLQEPYEFSFKGDPALVEAVFQAVGFSTSIDLSTPDRGSETHYMIHVAPPQMVLM